ncbi:MAG: toll/interleukin-1 receptor domain-containing protein [Anaerolineae bacterium]|nr:MAG: toll/interleukin-1 receptor domain-containing protein [Anaerolineae bacterium]
MKMPAGNPRVLYMAHSPDLPERAADWVFDGLLERLDRPLGRIDMLRDAGRPDVRQRLENVFDFTNALVLVIGPDWHKGGWTGALINHLDVALRRNLPVALVLVDGAEFLPEASRSLKGLLDRPNLTVFRLPSELGHVDILLNVAEAIDKAVVEIPAVGEESELELNSSGLPGLLAGQNLNELSRRLDTRVQIVAPRHKTRAANGGEKDESGAEPEAGEDLAQFSAFHPREAPAKKWLKLLVYVHADAAKFKVAEDAAEELADAPEKYALGEGVAQHGIKKGTAIRIVPQMRGFRFDPLETTVKWEDDYNRAAFRMMADPKAPGFKVGVAVNGRVTFMVGPVIVGEAEISTEILAEGAAASGGQAHASLPMYPKVFVSYSHKDKAIVEQVERATGLLGVQYLRDVNFLRSGEKWNPAILAKIDEANLFQLFWSANAKASRYVEQEWRHALAKGRPNFIRPTYWEQPMPQPPPELADLEFTPY